MECSQTFIRLLSRRFCDELYGTVNGVGIISSEDEEADVGSIPYALFSSFLVVDISDNTPEKRQFVIIGTTSTCVCNSLC